MKNILYMWEMANVNKSWASNSKFGDCKSFKGDHTFGPTWHQISHASI
jgi:hypothetical protein